VILFFKNRCTCIGWQHGPRSQSNKLDKVILDILIEDICFHGYTLWNDYSLMVIPIVYSSLYQDRMNNYKKIIVDPH